MAALSYAGGCLCGAVRFNASGPVLRVNHCHCTMCRRMSGAVAASWATFARDGFRIMSGTPAAYRASDFATRHFCAACGSTLFWQRDGATTIDIGVGVLDAPDDMAASRHDHAYACLPGFTLDPHLPRFDD